MADNSPKGNRARPGSQDENDPILQGVDRVQSKEEIDSHLASEQQEATEDTHTRSNIHLGGRDDEGKGTGPQEDETSVAPPEVGFDNLGVRNYPVPDGGPIEPSGAGFVPVTPPPPEDPVFQSSGRATPEVDIDETSDGRPTIEPYAAFSRNSATITPLAGDEFVPLVEEGEEPEGENGPPETAPVDLGSTDEDTSRTFSDDDLLVNATDPDGDPLTVSDVTINPDFGVIIDNGDGTYTFEPSPDFNGDDLPIDYTISDGTTDIPGSAIIDVLPINDPPTSADAETVIDEDTSYTFGPTDFEFNDIENDDFNHITIIDLPTNGTLTFDGGDVDAGDEILVSDLGLLVFSPDENENGDDYATFNFTVNDGADDSGEYTFSIDVTPVNDAPTSADEGTVIDEDTSYAFASDDFLFEDIDGDSLDHITIIDLPGEGELTLDGIAVEPGDEILASDIGLLVFTPVADENGEDYATFNFTVNDGTDDSEQYTYSIDVTPVNDPPSTEDAEVETAEDTDYTFTMNDFAFNDIDSSDMHHITIVDLPIEGTLYYDGVEVNAGDDIETANIGLLTFRPDDNENGDDYATFNFTVNDGDLDSDPQTITVDVTAVNDAPTLDDNETTILEDNSHTFELSDFTENYDDVESDSAAFITINSLPLDGTLTIGGAAVVLGNNNKIAVADIGDLVFTPADNENGDDYASFNFTVEDDGVDPSTSAEKTFTIDVTPVNDAPEVDDNEATILEDNTHVFDLADFAENYDDIEGDSAAFVTITSLPLDGALTIGGAAVVLGNNNKIAVADLGDLVFTPGEDENGDDYASFNFTVEDDGADPATSAEQTFTIDVTPVNDAPTSGDNEKTILEDNTYSFAPADFVYDDVESDAIEHITITELPADGELTLSGNPVGQGDEIAAADIANLLYTPDENASGENYGDFKFTVNDGTEDSDEHNFSIDVTADADTPDLCLLGPIGETTGLYDISGGGIVSLDISYNTSPALFENTHGYYVADSGGNPIGGAIIQDDISNGGSFEVSFNTDDYPGGVTLGFFIIPDGNQQNVTLEDGDAVTFSEVDGVWTPFVGGAPLAGAPSLAGYFDEEDSLPAFFSNPALNADGVDHLENNQELGNQNWEDIVFGGDFDYGDVNANLTVTLQTCDDTIVQGLEGTLIGLPDILTELNDTDGSEILSVTISSIPEGVTLSDDQGNEFTATDVDNDADVSGWNLDELKVFSPVGQDDFVVQVTSTATEQSNSDQASTSLNVTVDILHGPTTDLVDLGATPEDTGIAFTEAQLLENAADMDGDLLHAFNVTIDPAYGTITDNGAGNYTFNPAADFNGIDLPVSYEITDGLVTINGSAIIDVTPVNDVPTLDDNETTILEDNSHTFELSDFTENYDDVEGDSAAFVTITSLPLDGALTIGGAAVVLGDNNKIAVADLGDLVFTPVENESGDDYAAFNFTVEDDGASPATSAEHSFTVDVTPVNDVPTVDDDETIILEDNSHTFELSDFTENYDDVEGDSAAFVTITSLPLDGALTIGGAAVVLGGNNKIAVADIGDLVFTPADDENGDDYASFNFTVEDDGASPATSAEHSFTVDVTPVNDAPEVDDNDATILEDNSHTFELSDFTENYDDVEGDSAAFVTITSLPLDGALTIGGAAVVLGDNNKIAIADIGDLVFTPDENESADDYAFFNFTVEDDNADPATSAEHTFTVDVTAVADDPNLCVLTEKIDGSALYDISQGGIVTVNVEYFAVEAGYENSHGYYIADSDGNPIGGQVVKDNVKELGIEEISFDTADYPGGVTLGFFILPDGDTQNALLESDDAVTFQNIGGTWTPFVGGVALVGAQAAPAYFSDMALNPDGFDHFDDTGVEGNQNWEDLWNGGDTDNTDVNAFVTLRICDDEATVQGYEETPIALPEITGLLTDLDGSESLMMTISNVPDGVELKDGSGNSFTASPGDNAVDVTGWDLHSLEVIAPAGTDDFVLSVEAKSTEASNNDTATTNGTITVDILHVPTTSPVDLGATPEDTSVDFTAAKLLENAGDLDGDILSVSNVAIDPIYGTITDNGGGNYTFDPADDYNGDDLPISYDIFDGENTISGSAIIDVTPVNDVPTLDDNEEIILEDTSHTFGLADFTENYDDVEGDSAAFVTITSLPLEGSLTFGGDAVVLGDNNKIAVADLGGLVFSPDENESADDYASFNFTVEDDGASPATSAEQTFTIDVTADADAPEITMLIGDVVNEFETTPVIINTGNILDTDNGYTVTGRVVNPDGTLSEALAANLTTGPNGIGVGGVNDGPDDQLGAVESDGQSEEIIITVDESISSIDVVINYLFEEDDGQDEDEIGYYTLLEDGVEVGSGTFYGVAGGVEHTLSINPGGGVTFDQIVFTADQDLTTGAEGHSDYYISSATFDAVTDEVVTHLFPVTITTALTDTDGSESLSDVTVSDVPADATFEDGDGNPVGTNNNDGTWAFTNAELEGLMISVPVGHEDFDLTAAVTSTEASNADFETSITQATVDVPEAPVSVDAAFSSFAAFSVGAPLLEDTGFAFSLAHFSFSDGDGDAFDHITIVELPAKGELQFEGDPVVEGQDIPAGSIGSLVFVPDEHESGEAYTSYKFTVNDGLLDSEVHTFSIDVIADADAPTLSLSLGDVEVVTINDVDPTVITQANALDTDSGFELTARIVNDDGSLSEAAAEHVYVSPDSDYFAVGGENDGPDQQIGYVDEHLQGEELIVTLDEGVNSMTFAHKYLYADEEEYQGGEDNGGADELTHDEQGHYVLLSDGIQVGNGTFYGTEDGEDTFLTIAADDGVSFDQIIFTADPELTNDGDGHSDYAISSISFGGDDGETYNQFPVNIAATLVDADGSETLSDIALSGVPEGVFFTVAGIAVGSDNGDGSWSFTSDELDGIMMSVPEGQADFNLTASVTATETSNSDSETTTATVLVDVPEANFDEGVPAPENYDQTYGGGTNDQLYGDENQNYIDGREGNDKLYGDENNDILIGGSGNDDLNGEGGNDELYGGSGNDALFGEDGADTIYGGSGLDTIHAGDGDDTIYGGSEKDTIHGGEGNDLIVGGSGNDKMHGNDGNDVFLIGANEGDDQVHAGAGGSWVDTIELSGFSGLDHEVGWTLILDGGASIQSTDDATGEMLLSQDADGTITFDDGGSVTFENIEKISW